MDVDRRDGALAGLAASARDLANRCDATPGGVAEVADRLRHSVLRPLEPSSAAGVPADPNRTGSARSTGGTDRTSDSGGTDRTGSETPDRTDAGAAGIAEAVWALARSATRLRAEAPDRLDVAEATAALQDLALRLTDEADVAHEADEADEAHGAGAGAATHDRDAAAHDQGNDHAGKPDIAHDQGDHDAHDRPAASDRVAHRRAELADLQADLPARIQLVADGPLLATNLAPPTDWLGCPVPGAPQLALCRCGASRRKPLCDGSHAESGFSGAKRPERVPDRRDHHVGQQVEVLDNRGTCQHAGLCTDRLATVFHSDGDPFVTASGGRMDEIIRAVRDCPSGALAYAVDGAEARADVDHHGTRPPAVEITRDGPYRVTGGVPLVEADGTEVARNAGASFEHYALCRCGQSQNKPFCSGMHWYVDFHDPVADPGHEPTVFEWAGGLPALTRMTRLFYERFVPEDELLAPLFATMSADHPQRVAAWLAEVFGGPRAYSGAYGGYTRMLSQHLGRCLDEDQRARWVMLLLRSAREAGLPNDAEFRSAFSAYVEWGSRLAVENSQTAARPPAHMPMPSWGWDTAAGPPGSRVAALDPAAAAEDGPVALPGPGEAVRFEDHVRTWFRSRDRRSMRFAFDLWSPDDVAAHADAILARLEDGSMPCDGPWPADRVDAFRRWVAAGTPR